MNSPLLIASALLGLLHGSSFAAEHAAALHFVAWFGFGFLLLRERSRTDLALRSLAFFFFSFVSGLWWMAQSLAESTSLGVLLGAVTFIVCCLLLALLPAFALILVRVIAPSKNFLSVLAMAAAVALADFTRALVLTGFPWLQSGHAYAGSSIAALLPFIGTHGVGFVAIALALLGSAVVQRMARIYRAVAAAVAVLIIAAPVLLSAHAEAPVTKREHGTLRFALLQPATDFDSKFTRSLLAKQVQTLVELASTVEKPDVIVAPETAVPTTWQGVPSQLRSQLQTAASNGARWQFGAFDAGPQGLPLNVVVGLDGTSSITRTLYVKQHLVPFAEYTPPALAWFTDLLQLPMSQRASAPPLASQASDPLIHTICLDLLYPIGTNAIPAGGGVIVNHSNFAWSRTMPRAVSSSPLRELARANTTSPC